MCYIMGMKVSLGVRGRVGSAIRRVKDWPN